MTGVVSGWTTEHHILHELPCFYVIQETDNWTTSAMNVPGYIVYGTDHGRTEPFCAHGRSTIFVRHGLTVRDAPPFWGSTMLLSVYMPHSGRDEVDHIEALEAAGATLVEGKRMGAVDFSSPAI